jgi:hypothetical protein
VTEAPGLMPLTRFGMGEPDRAGMFYTGWYADVKPAVRLPA